MYIKIFGYFLRILQIIITFFLHRSKEHIIIGSSAGTNINGNAKALFLYMIANKTPVKAYFITRNKRLLKDYLELYPDNILYAYSIKSLLKFVSAKAYVITHGPYDVTPFLNKVKNKPLINIWHGFPIKKLGNDSHFLTEQEKSKVQGNFDGLIVMSEEEQKIMSRCYTTRLENTWITGYPRNDFVFEQKEDVLKKIPFIKGKKVLLYAPTFRDYGTTELFPFDDFELETLNNFLRDRNAILLMRVHRNELKVHNLKENDVVKICDESLVHEINEILYSVDILITDYSSVYIDNLLTNKPMMFIPYDLKKMSDVRGLNFEYKEVTPGPKVSTFKGFLNHIENYIKNPHNDEVARHALKTRFHKYQDNKSSKRVYDQIEQLIRAN